ncbi:hypothetical protein PL11_002215 [Lentilactobacillus curieae]|uniref:Uncharacterized protein n=1 Tax=Lentilactobacillus curieae TaxID=1138822 RepID=A0A1S6QGT6_9LACO|nr:hypothetical protein [Lentilactobacillus curieae]AQW20811.1 hypothetical protein PL11_002215 [Lentilactobacillus curieae]
MTERQMIQEILNTVDVMYDFENTDDDKKEYDISIHRQTGDKRPLEQINSEIKKYFQESDFSYDETLNPSDDIDIAINVKR